MGKFIDTKYYDTQDALVQMNKDLIQNPFYLYNDKKGTKVKYYNINMEKTTLDPGSKLAYDEIGSESPIRYNVINDLYIYQFIKAELQLDNEDFGMTGSPIQGESYILPDTITPYDGDWFEVDHVSKSTNNKWLFKVTDVQRDTLENGANVYKIGWVLDRTSNVDIQKNIVKEYDYINTVQGTNLKRVVESKDHKTAVELDNLSCNLQNYFNDLFWVERVQTFIYRWYNNYNMYDPFALEFIIRNNLLGGTDEYVHVQHQCQIPRTFSIDYDKSLYRAFELRDKNKLQASSHESQADYIDDLVGIFKTRFEMYWKLNYKVLLEANSPYNPKQIIPIMEQDLLDAIMDNKYDDRPCYERIIIKYFNNEEIYSEDIEAIECIDLEDNRKTYYTLLFLIFILDFYTKKLLS